MEVRDAPMRFPALLCVLTLSACSTAPSWPAGFGDPADGRSAPRWSPAGPAKALPSAAIGPLDLGGARRLALERNHDLAAARAAVRAARAAEAEARAAWWPTVQAEASWTFNSDRAAIDAGPFGPITISPGDVRRARLGVDLSISRFGRDGALLDAARAGTLSRRLEQVLVRWQLREAVGRAWFRWHEVHAGREVAASALEAARRQRADAESLLEAGRVTRDAVLDAAAEETRRASELSRLEHEIAVAGRALNRLLVRAPNAPLDLAPPPLPPTFRLDADDLFAEARDRQPDLLVFRTRRIELERRREAVLLGAAPEFFARLESAWNDPATDTGLSNNQSATLGVRWTPYAGGARIARAQALQEELTALRHRELATRDALRGDIADLCGAVELTRTTLAAAESRKQATAESARIAGERFLAGTLTARERLLAETAASEAAFSVVRERFTLHRLHLALERATGLGLPALRRPDPEESP